ncbi:MAG: zinc-dependent metalloprotease [Chitinophagaceae bacterium]
MKTFYSVLLLIAITIGAQAQVPVLSSYPAARATIYLDFDGQYVKGTGWNWAGPITAQPAALSTDAITEVFNRVSEDYRIFNINITTDSNQYNNAPALQRVRIIITSTYSWYGSNAGGVSYVGSFTWGDNTPGWVFAPLLSNNPKYIAEAASHEAGHTLGLQHQSTYDDVCAMKEEYSTGRGNGEIGWAPIMGKSYSRNLTTWYYGRNVKGCDVWQDDINIIASATNNFGLRSDDHANSHTTATPIIFSGLDFEATGLINDEGDRDVFRFTMSTPGNFRLSAIPQNVGSSNAGANVDIKISLLNQYADTINRYNPADLLSAGIDSNLNVGTYYLVVDGVGNAFLSDFNSVGYYSLSGSIGTTLPIHRLTLSGKVASGTHTLNWEYEADEAVKQTELQYSTDGRNFTAFAQLSSEARTFSWKPVNNGTLYYRARVITVAEERSYYSNILPLREATGSITINNTLVTDLITVNADKAYQYQLLDGTGRLLQQGKLTSGINRLSTNTVSKGLLLLHVQSGNESQTWKLIKQ